MQILRHIFTETQPYCMYTTPRYSSMDAKHPDGLKTRRPATDAWILNMLP